MAHVSLIVTSDRAGSPTTPEIAAARTALTSAGHAVEVLVAVDPGAGDGEDMDAAPVAVGSVATWNQVSSSERGRAAAAIAGLQAARGEVVLVLNPDRGYTPEDLVRVVDSLDPSQPEIAVASRLAGMPGKAPIVFPKALLGNILRVLTGSSDPLSGLIGLTRPALERALGGFKAVGSQFSLELLAKVRGRRVDVPARPVRAIDQRGRPRFDDIRHLKHLADHRFGNVSRLMQFCVVGASGMVVDLTCYAVFQEIFFRVPWLAANPVPPTRVPFALAIARGLAISVALVWNFALNRRLTFSYARGGSRLRQFVAYVLSNLLGVSVSMALSLGLPSRVAFFHDHRLFAAVVGIVVATGISFTMSRWLVFRGSGAPDPADLAAPLPGPSPSPRADPAMAKSSISN